MNTKRDVGDEIIKSMQEAVDYMRGKKTRAVTHKVKIPDKINVKSIRMSLRLSRLAFANRFGFSSRTLQHWEQGNRRPQGAARVLLLLLQRDPETIENILNPELKSQSIKYYETSNRRVASSYKVMEKKKSYKTKK